MAQPKKHEWQRLQTPDGARELHRMLDVLLALDRTVVELSMRLYKIPQRHQVAMREQNRQLHAAFRARLPRS